MRNNNSSSSISTEITEAKTVAKSQFYNLFYKTNPELYEFWCNVIDQTSASNIQIPAMSEDEMLKTSGAVAYMMLNEKGKEIFANEKTKESLLKTLNETKNDEVRRRVAWAIGNIACSEKGQEIFANEKTKESLLKTLNETKNDEVRSQVAGAIGNIACSKKGQEIFTNEEANESLLKTLNETTNDKVREQAAWAILNIARSENGREIFANEETKESLLKILNKPTNDEVRRRVARAIGNIARSENGREIFANEKVEQGLRKALTDSREESSKSSIRRALKILGFEISVKVSNEQELKITGNNLEHQNKGESDQEEELDDVSWDLRNIEIRPISQYEKNKIKAQEGSKNNRGILENYLNPFDDEDLQSEFDLNYEEYPDLDQDFQQVSTLNKNPQLKQDSRQSMRDRILARMEKNRNIATKAESLQSSPVLENEISEKDLKTSDPEEIKQRIENLEKEQQLLREKQIRFELDQEKLISLGKSNSQEFVSLEEQHRNIVEKIKDLGDSLSVANHAFEIANSAKLVGESLSNRVKDFDFSSLPKWIQDLNLNQEQITALNKIDGFRIEELNEYGIKDAHDKLREIEKISEDNKRRVEEKFSGSSGLVTATSLIYEKQYKEYCEQKELAKDEKLLQVAQKIESEFNKCFAVSTIISTGKIKLKEGKITNAVKYASVLLGVVPFGLAAGGVVSALVSHGGEISRNERYSRFDKLSQTNDPSEIAEFSEKIGRKVALTDQVNILGDLVKLNDDPKKVGIYLNKLAKSCSEVVLSRTIDIDETKKKEKINPKLGKSWKDEVIEGVILHNNQIRNKTVYEMSHESVKSFNKEPKPMTTADNMQLFAMIQEMKGEIQQLQEQVKTRGATIEQQKAIIQNYDAVENQSSKQGSEPSNSTSAKSANQVQSQIGKSSAIL